MIYRSYGWLLSIVLSTTQTLAYAETKIPFADAFKPTPSCSMSNPVTVSDPIISEGGFPQTVSFNLEVTNNTNKALAGIRIVYIVRTKGRSVPWLENHGWRGVSGGIEPSETRKLSFGSRLPAEAFDFPPLEVEASIADLEFHDESKCRISSP